MPAKVALNIDQSFLYTHLVCFSRHGVLDIAIARILYLIAHARALSMIERGCYALFSLFLFPPVRTRTETPSDSTGSASASASEPQPDRKRI